MQVTGAGGGVTTGSAAGAGTGHTGPAGTTGVVEDPSVAAGVVTADAGTPYPVAQS